MAIPRPEICLGIAAGLLNAAADDTANTSRGNPEWSKARAMIAQGYIALAAAQEHRLNPEDAATWTPGDGVLP
jgi:hypothetical protein